MARNILIGDELRKAQEQFKADNNIEMENAPLGVLSEGIPVQRPSGMSARRESSFRDLIRNAKFKHIIVSYSGDGFVVTFLPVEGSSFIGRTDVTVNIVFHK